MTSQPSSRPGGIEGIRSLKDEDAIFQAFDSYPWVKDKNFMAGLYAILGEPGAPSPQDSFGPRGSLVDMATHARVFYYFKQIGVSINFTGYQDWLAKHPEHQPPSIIPEVYRSQLENSQPLEWQKAAPKAELYVDRNAANAQNSADDGPNYPMGFAEMLKLIQEGKPVPGIRQIPNTVVRDPSVKPVGARAAPRKPWERDNTAPAANLPNIPKALDTEFPPVDDEVPQTGTA